MSKSNVNNQQFASVVYNQEMTVVTLLMRYNLGGAKVESYFFLTFYEFVLHISPPKNN